MARLALLLVLGAAHALRLPPPLSRRHALGAALAAVAAPTRQANAAYGEAANQAPPALVPSPFYPTGEMAKTCEVVAVGRDDVCLKPLKQLTSYDELRLAKAGDSLKGAGITGTPATDEAIKLIELVQSREWSALATELGLSLIHI